MRRFLILGVILFGVAATAATASDDVVRQLSVTGEGKVDLVPDMATITTGVRTQGETAREAVTANNAAMQALVDELKAAGIFDRDIQTSNFSVQPRYVHSDERDASGYARPPRIDGYEVSNSVFIRVRDLDALGAVLDRAVTVGANAINGISFSLSDPQSAYAEARREAFANAKEKAQTYAQEGGFVLGDVMMLSEHQGSTPPPMPMARQVMAMEMASAVPVQAGEVSTQVTVNVTWEIVNPSED